jgi:hypothetical protein
VVRLTNDDVPGGGTSVLPFFRARASPLVHPGIPRGAPGRDLPGTSSTEPTPLGRSLLALLDADRARTQTHLDELIDARETASCVGRTS